MEGREVRMLVPAQTTGLLELLAAPQLPGLGSGGSK